MVNGVLYATAGEHATPSPSTRRPANCCGCIGSTKGRRADASSRRLSGRGVGYWTDGKGDERVFYVTIGYQLVGLDAKTGHPLSDFGEPRRRRSEEGRRSGSRSDRRRDRLERRAGRREKRRHRRRRASRRHRAAQPHERQGLHPRLRRAEPASASGSSTRFRSPANSATRRGSKTRGPTPGNTGVWTQMTVDEELGLAYLPVEIPTGDYYGGHRPGNNLFAESLVAVDLQTGERRWHFQFVHHPIWDYDVPCAPILADITVDGKTIKAIAQPTKQGLVFVFDRATGKPVFPIEERPVERGTVPREWYSPTQPFPLKPPPFERQGFLEEYVIDFTPAAEGGRAEGALAVQDRARSTRRRSRAARAARPGCSSFRTARTGQAARSIRTPASSTSTRTRCCACCRWSTSRSART